MCVFCDSAAASQSSVLGRIVAKHRRSEPHRLQHAVCVQDADDDLSRNRSVGDHAFTVDHSQLDPSSVRKVSTTESYILSSELSRCKLSPTLATAHDTIQHDTRRYLTCTQKPTSVSIIYLTEPTTKQWKTEKLKSKNGYAQKYR